MESDIKPDRNVTVKRKLLIKIARKIKTLRMERKISQKQFYTETKIHIGRIEQGKINVSISTLCDICEYFGVNFREFFAEFA